MVYDGTVGKACQANSDCQPPGGPGVSLCSNTAFTQPIWPTPVCVITTCDPVDPTGNGAVQFCDGAPTDTSAPGLCVPTTNPIQKGMGICMPKCTFGANFSGPGGAPLGCQGKDTCNVAAFAVDNTGAIVGVGYCFGGCVSDGDCPAGSKCQVDQAVCLKSTTTPTKTIGQACTSADTTNNVCSCESAAATGMGICTQSCIAGGAACPAGYACDSGETTTVPGLAADGGAVPGFSQQTAGLAGVCLPTCGAGGANCPANLTCLTTETVGPVCAP